MSKTDHGKTPYSIRKFFAGKSVLITGSTGFLAKAIVEKVLRDLPDVEKIYLLIRPRAKANGSLVDPKERLHEDLLRNSVFHVLRAKHGGNFTKFCEEKIVCVPGDLTHVHVGMDDQIFAELVKKVDVVIHSAATVVFDERLDLALTLNTLAGTRLLELCQETHAAYKTGEREKPGATYVHMSTAYVSGKRRGHVPEKLLEPLVAIDAQLPPGEKRPDKLDVEHEIQRLSELSKNIIKDCEAQIQKNGMDPASDDAKGLLRRALVNAGMTRARSLGWNDTYTYTKFLGEQLVKMRHGEVPTMIVRPSIIESSLREPEPGWLDGLRMADPIIIGFGKGRLDDFPAGRDVVLDVIPADLVVNATLAAAAHISRIPSGFDLIQVASSSENPLVFQYLYDCVRDYFQKQPFLDRKGKPVPVPTWKFPSIEAYRSRVKNRMLRPTQFARAIIDGPITMPGTRKLKQRLRTLSTTLEQLLYYVDIYSPYTNLDCRFETKHLREIGEQMDPEERGSFDFDPRRIRWRHYLQDVHIPGLKRNILRMEEPPRAGAGEGNLLDEETERAAKRRSTAIHGVPQTILELAWRSADRYGNKLFLEMTRAGEKGPETIQFTYGELWDRSAEYARKLRSRLGLENGDRVVLWSENSPEWILSYLAISRAGATAVPLDKQLPVTEAIRIAQVVEAKALIVSPSLIATHGEKLAHGLGLPTRLNLRNGLEPYPGDRWPVEDAQMSSASLKQPTPETLASLLFTSGTTFNPKGVMLTHGNFASNALAVAEVLEPLDTDEFLSVLPLHHALEFTGGMLTPMFGGATVHYIDTLKGKEVTDAMKKYGVTVIIGIPRLFQLFADGVKAEIQKAGFTTSMAMKLMDSMAGAAEAMGGDKTRKKIFTKVHAAFGGKVRLFVSGGAALHPDTFAFFKKFGLPVIEGYGLTETSPILTVNPLGAPRGGSVGLPLPGVELKVRNPDLQGVGEILAVGSSIMPGYWRDPEATEKVFEDGWFRTGDLGRFDADGYLHLTGRLKEVIVTAAGKNVYPDELEQHFTSLVPTRAKEYSIVGLPARQGHGDETALVVVLAKSEKSAEEEVRALVEKVNQALPSHQRVARVEFLSTDLPKTSTLKVQRGKVRDRIALSAQAALSAAAEPKAAGAGARLENPEELFVDVAEAVAETANVNPAEITPGHRLQLDLGLDSIGRVDLIGKIEHRLNLSIPDETLAKLSTVGDLVDAVKALKGSSTKKSGKTSEALAERVWKRGADHQDPQHLLKPTLSGAIVQTGMNLTSRVFFNTYLNIEAYGLENLPANGAFMLASNHNSHLDTAAVRVALGSKSAHVHVMGAKDYFFDSRLKSWFFSNAFNVLPFEREEHNLDGLATCRSVLKSGRGLLIFPEGTRSLNGDLMPFKAGIGLLALELEFPVLPVYVRGTFEALPKGRSLPRPSKVVVRFGPAVPIQDLIDRKKDEGGKPTKLYREAAERIRSKVALLAAAP